MAIALFWEDDIERQTRLLAWLEQLRASNVQKFLERGGTDLVGKLQTAIAGGGQRVDISGPARELLDEWRGAGAP
jgi:hypothetical protein